MKAKLSWLLCLVSMVLALPMQAALSVPEPPSLTDITSAGTTMFETAAVLGLTVLGLGVVVGAILAGLRMGKKRVG